MVRIAMSVLAALACCSTLFAQAAKPFSVFARSPRYSMNVEVVPLSADDTRFNVTVVDLETNSVVAQPALHATHERPQPVSDSDLGDVHFRIAVARMTHELSANLDVTKGITLVDSIRTIWTVAPHPLRTPPPGGVIGGVAGGGVTMGVPYRVGGDVQAPIAIRHVEPSYTDEARRARISGIVILELVVDKTGKVRDATVLKPLPYGLDKAAVDAVKQWQFQPGTLYGQPVDVIFNVTVDFNLKTKPE